MPTNPQDIKLVSSILLAGEKVMVSVTQRRIGPGGSVTSPTSVFATDMRIIIVNRASIGIRKAYEVIPYRQITSVRLENGIIASSVFIRVEGYDTDKGLLQKGKEEGEIDGLRNSDAKALADEINRRIAYSDQPAASEQASGNGIYCTKCGAKNSPGANFCAKCGQPLQK